MSWGQNPKLSAQWHATIERLVFDTVTWYRNRGHQRDIAIEQTALALGMSSRKTRSIYDHEPIGIKREQFERAFAAYLLHLDYRAEDHLRQIAAIKAKRQQMELEFG